MMSTTRIAISHKDDPRLRRFVNDSWPGVSITRIPGTLMSNFPCSGQECDPSMSCQDKRSSDLLCDSACFRILHICSRILSRIFVLPVSTCPMMHMIGQRSRSFERLFFSTSNRNRRAVLAVAIRVCNS